VYNLRADGRWAFAELTEVYRIESDFEVRMQAEFARIVSANTASTPVTA
jgi:type III restriction enzyme